MSGDSYLNGNPVGNGSGGPITAADITDSTSVGRSVLTATDAAAARAAIGVSGVSAGAIADLSNGGAPTNAFHLIEGSGAFADNGSSPQTLTVTGGFRRGRLGPRALVSGVWPPVSPGGTYLSVPAAFGATPDPHFSVGITILGNGEAGPSGKILMAGWGDSPVHEVVWVDPTHVRVILHHASIGPVPGPLIAVDPTKPIRILYTYAYHSPWLYVNGVGTDCGSAYSFTNNGFTNVLAMIEAAGFSANDLEFWSGVTLTADQAVADYERFAQAFGAAASGGSITSTDITDSTSVGRAVLTATDAAAARTAIGVTGGGTHGSGTLAARPASPAAGDTYAVTSGAQSGARFTCFVDGSWEGSMSFSAGHSWERTSAASAGGGARFLDVDTGVITVSSGDDAVGWYVELPTRLGGDRAALGLVGGSVGASSLDLSSLTLGGCTVAVLLRWDGGATAYEAFFGLGAPTTANHGINAYFKVNGSNINLITYQNGAETVLLAAANPTVGLHALVIAPVSHDFGGGAVAAWAFSLDGSAMAYVAMAGAYGAPTTTAPLYLGRDGAGANDFHGAICDFAVWQSTLSGAQIAALSTLPGTATYRLPITSGMGAPWLRAEANRYDPAFSTTLPAKVGSRPVALTASGVTKTEY